MASTAEIYGKIGAAKAFSSSVSDSLKLQTGATNAEIRDLEEELQNTVDEKERKRIVKRIKRLRRRNIMNNLQSKSTMGVNFFLGKIADYMDIGIGVLIRWISNIIVSVLPALEVSVKMLLLTNIKKMISCAIDPRIPDDWRVNGVILNEAFVDPRCILKTYPYSKYGKYLYFGCFDGDKPKITHELARAEDMNAFLWYAKNCAKFVSPNIILPSQMGTYFADGEDTTFYTKHEFKGVDEYRYVEGSTFKNNPSSSTIFLCEKCKLIGGDRYYTIVPATDVWTGITWYKDRKSITGLEKKKTEINYDKSKPLFNIEYQGTYGDASLFRDGNFRFRILPKPFSTAGGFFVDLENNANVLANMANTEYVSELVGTELNDSNIQENNLNYQFSGIQSPMPHVARFNSAGIYDKKGKYSINTRLFQVIEVYNVSQKQYKENPGLEYIIRYNICPNGTTTVVGSMVFDKKTKTFELRNPENPSEPATEEQISEVITECYFGKTVYEFNYDYVVSMKLFDAKSIASGIVDALLNVNIPNAFRRYGSGENSITNIDQIRIDSYVDALVDKMIQSEDYEFTDCFYTFSNRDYERMEQEVADKVANSTLITDNSENSLNAIYNIIDSYSADATLHEQEETITRAITKAADACGFTDNSDYSSSVGGSGSSLPAYKTAEGNAKSIDKFIQQAIQFLTGAIVNAILTPKVLMLIQVNRMLMGTDALPTTSTHFKDNYTYTVEDVLNGLSGILKGIIRQIIDTIQKELLKLILQRLSDMMAGYLKRLGVEYAMKWVLLLRQLLACFKSNRSKMSAASQYSDAINDIINQVDYADIDSMMDEILPNTNPC